MKTLISLIAACAALAFVSSSYGVAQIDDGPNGLSIGSSTNQKVGFHGAKVVQRAGTAGAALSTNAILGSNVSLAGVDGSTNTVFLVNSNQLQSVLRLLIELRATIVEKGIHKGQ